MTHQTRFPIRLKILLSLLFVVTSVVRVITFTMATLFHEDKTTYINDLIVETKTDKRRFLKWCNVSAVEDIAAKHYDMVVSKLNQKKNETT